MKRVIKSYSLLFWIFILGSFIGFAWENIWTIIKGAYHLRQGLIYEPLIPIYGIGAILYYLIFNNIKIDNFHTILKIILVFIISFIVGSIFEYICSLFQENIFGTISWNYTKYKFNINGRISLMHSTFWGILGIIFYFLIMPLLIKMDSLLDIKIIKVITIILSIILFTDCFLSASACLRQRYRREGIESHTRYGEFLDQHYPDSRLDRIYNNARVVKGK